MTRQMLEMTKVTDFLEACLRLRGWKIADIARETYLDRKTFERMRGGEPYTPSPSTVALIAYAVGIDPHEAVRYVITGSGRMPDLLGPWLESSPAPDSRLTKYTYSPAGNRTDAVSPTPNIIDTGGPQRVNPPKGKGRKS